MEISKKKLIAKMATLETKSSISSLSSVATNTLPVYITIEPKQLIFQESNSKMSNALLRIMSVSRLRIAFRIRTNAPTQYIVMPSTGFLSANESINVLITNLNIKKYHRRHRFIIQAMKARENNQNRRKIWNDSRAKNLDLIQCIRLITLKVSRKQSEESERSGNGKFNQLTTSSDSETGESETIQKQIMTDKEKLTKIDELNKQINNKLEEKRKQFQCLIKAVNEVKLIEINLDRATAQCNELNNVIISQENQKKITEEKLTKINAILDTSKIKID